MQIIGRAICTMEERRTLSCVWGCCWSSGVHSWFSAGWDLGVYAWFSGGEGFGVNTWFSGVGGSGECTWFSGGGGLGVRTWLWRGGALGSLPGSCMVGVQGFIPGSRVVGVIAGDWAAIEQEFALFLHLLLLSEVKFAPTAAARTATQGSAAQTKR